MNDERLSLSSLWSMTKESLSSFSDDYAPSMGAALAYYTIFSIAPLLVIVIAIAGFFFGEDAASGRLYHEISGLVGDNGAQVVQGLVSSASHRGEGIVSTIVGVVVLVIGATTVFAELQNDLDRIWRSPDATRKGGLVATLKGRVMSLGLVAAIGFLLLVSLVVSAALSAISGWWSQTFGAAWVPQVLNFVVSLAVITTLFALMYKLLPRVRIGWRDVWIGAFVTALLFSIGKYLVGLYLGHSSVASGFGAAGSLVVLLVWVYYSAQIFLLGAEFTGVYSHRFGSRKGIERAPSLKQSLATQDEAEQSETPRRAAPAQRQPQPSHR